MLFYEASGKRQRTCDECLRKGSPPEHCKASIEDQKGVLDLIYEAKQEADLKKEQEGGGGKAAGGGKKKLSPDEVALQRGKTKKSDIATWADWGIPPSSLTKAKELAARKKERLGENKAATHKSKAEVPGGGSSGAEDPQAEEEPEHLGFSVFVPDDAEEGDSIEVALPNGKKMVAYVEKIAAAEGDILQGRTMPVEVAFGYDGVFYAVRSSWVVPGSTKKGDTKASALNGHQEPRAPDSHTWAGNLLD